MLTAVDRYPGWLWTLGPLNLDPAIANYGCPLLFEGGIPDAESDIVEPRNSIGRYVELTGDPRAPCIDMPYGIVPLVMDPLVVR